MVEKTLENAYNAVPLDEVPLVELTAKTAHTHAVYAYEHGDEDDKKMDKARAALLSKFNKYLLEQYPEIEGRWNKEPGSNKRKVK